MERGDEANFFMYRKNFILKMIYKELYKNLGIEFLPFRIFLRIFKGRKGNN